MKRRFLSIPAKARSFINGILPFIFWIDLFCGAGGTSTGIHLSGPYTKVIACVNHDRNAINSHEENHPGTVHFVEDIRDKRVVGKLKKIVDRLRAQYPGCIVNIWASLECTNFSKAKGGLSRDADSRTLAEHMYMYLEAIKPDNFFVENVSEFLDWGPLRAKCLEETETVCHLAVSASGKLVMIPDKTRLREYYNEWVDQIKGYGYQYEHRLLNSADFGSYQSRKRLFIQFVKNGLPIAWPEQTHSQKPTGKQHKWKPVKDVLDLEDEGKSIFGREKPLCENTLKRLYAGLVKFVARGEDTFRKQYNGNGSDAESRVFSLSLPCGTILNNGTHAIVSATKFLSQRNTGEPGSKVCDINSPSRTITGTGGNLTIVSASHLSTYYGKGGTHHINGPAPTVTTKDRISLVKTVFLKKYFSGHDDSKNISVNGPCGTVKTKDNHAVLVASQGGHKLKLIDHQYGNSSPTSIEVPSGCVTGVPKMNLLSISPWILNPNFKRVGTGIDGPCPTILASRKHYYLMNPQYNNKGANINNPCFTLIARMDKAPPYVLTAAPGQPAIILFESDSPMTRKVKMFMAEYGIVDIKMRMLKIPELLQIQGFPKEYILKGTLTEQKKYIGNAVEVNMAKALITANTEALRNHKNKRNEYRINPDEKAGSTQILFSGGNERCIHGLAEAGSIT